MRPHRCVDRVEAGGRRHARPSVRTTSSWWGRWPSAESEGPGLDWDSCVSLLCLCSELFTSICALGGGERRDWGVQECARSLQDNGDPPGGRVPTPTPGLLAVDGRAQGFPSPHVTPDHWKHSRTPSCAEQKPWTHQSDAAQENLPPSPGG